jgi:hypothetical protein
MLEDALTRGWSDLVGRWSGPMSFRLLMQPAVAILFAIRAGLRDARSNVSPFLGELLANPSAHRQWLRQVWAEVGTVFVVALILDAIYQVIVHASIYTLELLLTATLLALIPYVLARDIVARIARRAGCGAQLYTTPRDEKSVK